MTEEGINISARYSFFLFFLSLSETSKYIYIYLARTPEIGQGLGRILSCGVRKPERT